jgi:molybdenum cofactor cytidylyltransferase
MAEIPVLLLAAGSSSRMGQPKQLLAWGNVTLIEHQIITLVKTGNPVNVVLGCKSDLITSYIEKYKINIIINRKWKEGMGSSISCGINQIIKTFPESNGVLITLVDQPLITTDYFETMTDSFRPGCKQILVSKSCSGWIGVPALFDKFYFRHLLKLSNDQGAKKIISWFEEKVNILNCNDLMEDIDSPQAYQFLQKKNTNQSSHPTESGLN